MGINGKQTVPVPLPQLHKPRTAVTTSTMSNNYENKEFGKGN
jgi:hypothetical protein